ncbi:protein kinase domain-containing protein [Subtercola frigoramans]|uniref:protein kinase domain-containing protein n=1 Tax=Subtercola frigoramans TaxID=120298 RepID=UPI0027DE5D80|nr:protein kinase [Subtercola frigoramans]
MELVGQGAMASVYRARDLRLDRDVAVKLIDSDPSDPAEATRKAEEAKILASLNHHSLVTLHDAGIDDSDPARLWVYLVMELLGGTDLKKWLTEKQISSRHIAQIGYDLAEGLEYIHDHGVTHRDVKPANILIAPYSNSSRARAKLTDFGIAMTTGVEHYAKGVTTGTAAYLSPEQARGLPVGPATDVYALGLVLLQCFTREFAFPGTPTESAIARLRQDPAIPSWLSPDWQILLRAMTSAEPEARPLGGDLVDAFRRIVITETSRHRSADTHTTEHDEPARLQAVHRYHILDTPQDATFDRITALTARVMGTPVALISIVDHDRIWLKSHHGLDIDQIDREPGLCSSAIMNDEPWIIENARTDSRAHPNSLVDGEFGLQFYVGVPLRTRDGYNLGTLSVLDFQPRTVTDDEIHTMKDLAAVVINELELRNESRQALIDTLTQAITL